MTPKQLSQMIIQTTANNEFYNKSGFKVVRWHDSLQYALVVDYYENYQQANQNLLLRQTIKEAAR